MMDLQRPIEELHRAFELMNVNLFTSALPRPAILIQNQGRKKNILGWCSSSKIWYEVYEDDKGQLQANDESGRYEITITAEYLYRGAVDICETMLHEMCHLYNSVNNIQDCSRSGHYHNKRFKECAEIHGLKVAKAPSIGWALTSLQDRTKKLIESFNLDDEAFKMLRLRLEGSGKAKKQSMRKMSCKCGNVIRVTKPGMKVICAECEEYFKEEEAEIEAEAI